MKQPEGNTTQNCSQCLATFYHGKIISCKGGNTTSMTKLISIIHHIRLKCHTFDNLRTRQDHQYAFNSQTALLKDPEEPWYIHETVHQIQFVKNEESIVQFHAEIHAPMGEKKLVVSKLHKAIYRITMNDAINVPWKIEHFIKFIKGHYDVFNKT